jgi:hypothetical protein
MLLESALPLIRDSQDKRRSEYSVLAGLLAGMFEVLYRHSGDSRAHGDPRSERQMMLWRVP